ncbi:MAG: type II toxin-antitoxin system death-on-curing family toxin [Verrucomicrobiae bacterium]|nr:type II toxin-antitoxin system death-on-curing family toxin [Verrucomicrobiae bacterium]
MTELPKVLRLAEVYGLHQRALREHGGSDGVREPGLVESALGSAENTFWYGNGDLAAIAAAYAFHLAESQAFVDGNKRVGIAAALVFLAMNGLKYPEQADDSLYHALIEISEKRQTKADLAELFRARVTPL